MRQRSFDIKLKSGDNIQLYNNSFLLMLGIPTATGKITQVRHPGDGFVFECKESANTETVLEGDGEVMLVDYVNT